MSSNPLSFITSLFEENEKSKTKILLSFKAKADAKRTFSEKIADWMTTRFGTMAFLGANVVLFIAWVLINTNRIPTILPFDPFPFSLLTTIVSLEAIILAIFVLISQNRGMKVDDLREEVHLQVNLISEREISKIMKMMVILLEKHDVDLSEDSELVELLKPISEDDIEKMLHDEVK